MKEDSSSSGAVGEAVVPDLWLVLQDLEDGVLSPEQRGELMERLESCAASRQAYFEYFHQSAVFRMEGAKMHEVGLLPVGDLSLSSRRLFQRSILAAAAAIAALGIVATLIAVKQPQPGVLSAAVAAETRWMVDGEVQPVGDRSGKVVEGSTVRVMTGTVRLEVASGATLVLQGPSRVAFPDLRRPVLESGWLWIDAGEADEPFAVSCRGWVIRDIGTRFGVRAPAGGPAEIHLVSGEVEIAGRDGEKDPVVMKTPGRALVLRSGRDAGEMEAAPDPFPGLEELLQGEANYRTTILGQGPVSYWPLNEPAGLEFGNEVSGGERAGAGLRIEPGAAGVGPGNGFAGFGPENLAVRLTGDAEKSVLLDLDGGRGVSRREGAVSFWIRRPGNLAGGETLWLAGETYSGFTAPEQAILFTELTETGHVRFSIENGKFDVTLSSSRSVADGDWHQVVASWGPNSVDLYVDGKLAARDVDSRVLKEGTFSGRYVRFGKPSADLRAAGVGVFTGWVDEIALWNRPVSHAEVSQQFRSARGR